MDGIIARGGNEYNDAASVFKAFSMSIFSDFGLGKG